LFTNLPKACSQKILMAVLCFTPMAGMTQAAAVKVGIIGPDASYAVHNATAIATELNQIFAAASGYAGSSVSATVLGGRTLTEAYYHPSYRAATRAVLDVKQDYLILLPETGFLYSYPEMVFDGVLQMSRRALNAGATPLLLMPGNLNTFVVNTIGSNTYRVANGCGIDAIPGAYGTRTANLLTPPDDIGRKSQAYLLAAMLFRKITGLNAADTSYIPTYAGTPLDVVNLTSIANTTLSTHQSTVHYSTSRETTGRVRYRTITPASNTVRYAWTGTSTETGISGTITPILQSSGYTASAYKTSSTLGWSQTTLDTATSTFNANPNQFLFAIGRVSFISLAAQSLINTNQANLIPFNFDRHYDDIGRGTSSINNVLDDIYNRTETADSECGLYGWAAIPFHLGAARLNDIDPSVIFSTDSIHVTSPLYTMMASMMITSALGREPVPTSAILADTQLSNGFNVGKQTIRELAFLSETMAYVPDTTLAVNPANMQAANRWEAFAHTFTATGGTPPYTWSETSAAGLPPGLSLSAGGVLSGTITTPPQTWQLAIKVTDSTGAIRKMPVAFTLNAGAGSLALTPASDFPSSGNPGGPFSPATQTYTLNNPGLTAIQWTATKTAPWLTLSANAGTLNAGASATVTVSFNTAAASLSAALYQDTVTFTNTTNGNGSTSRAITLRVNTAPTASAGNDQTANLGGPTPWTAGITYHPITGDEDSGISSDKTYTHAIDFGADTTRALINGVQFQAGGATFGTISGTSATVGTGTTTITAGHAGNTNAAPFLNGASACAIEGLVKDMHYNALNGTITLTGLTPGVHYQFRLYHRSYGTSAAARGQNIGFDVNGISTDITGSEYTATFNEDDARTPNPAFATFSQVNALTLDYVLPAGVTTMKTYINATSTATYHLYGLTNEKMPEFSANVNLTGSASDSDNDPLATTWSIVSAPPGRNPSFANAQALNTTATLYTPGVYVFRLSANDGVATVTDDVTITLLQTPPYSAWTGAFPNLTNPSASLDFDNGSLPTGIEWVVGGNPSTGTDDAVLTPTLDRTTDPNGKLLFIFRRTTAAKNDANTTINVEYDDNLSGWTTAVHQGTAANQITITEQTNGFGAGIDKVTVALPPTLAANGALFARLKVLLAP
jgi:hypothetical protein